MLEEIKKNIRPFFSSEIKIKNTQYKGYNVINFELEKPKLDQTFFPVLRITKIKINGEEKVGIYLSHSKLKSTENEWKIGKIFLFHNKEKFSIY
ncbi:MAG: hypothetical protein PHY40_01485 [Patescibacteria group bacterium]|nr:hypothetical protein [Patescibacteria group bacterium]